jgi:hypothetical protein
MYPSVPTSWPALVRPAADVIELSALTACACDATPKSRSFACPRPVIFTFAGVRSRWTIPRSCATSRASAICPAIASASSTPIALF